MVFMVLHIWEYLTDFSLNFKDFLKFNFHFLFLFGNFGQSWIVVFFSLDLVVFLKFRLLIFRCWECFRQIRFSKFRLIFSLLPVPLQHKFFRKYFHIFYFHFMPLCPNRVLRLRFQGFLSYFQKIIVLIFSIFPKVRQVIWDLDRLIWCLSKFLQILPLELWQILIQLQLELFLKTMYILKFLAKLFGPKQPLNFISQNVNIYFNLASKMTQYRA